ncbi:hypothetical protein P2Q00_42800 [Streptomyces coacervatus]|nr:hypothetical protein [Streptomyces coacervatus]MDF2272095.1 hypothetical protein [Streptomyces coacervatus]
MAVASQGVTALVTEMVRGGWDAIRGAFARFLHRDGQAADRQLALFDEAAQTLARGADNPDSEERRRLESRLVLQLAAYLDRFPDMADELRALLPDDTPEPSTQGPLLSAQHNTHSQVVQALGNLDAGSGGINYGTPPRPTEA